MPETCRRQKPDEGPHRLDQPPAHDPTHSPPASSFPETYKHSQARQLTDTAAFCHPIILQSNSCRASHGSLLRVHGLKTKPHMCNQAWRRSIVVHHRVVE